MGRETKGTGRKRDSKEVIIDAGVTTKTRWKRGRYEIINK